MAGTTPPQRLRTLIENGETLALPGVFDALSARLAEGAGFEAVFTSGFGISATTLGMPDMGLLTMAENTGRVDQLTDSIDVPLVADMDTGYGNVLNVRRTMNECVDAGVAGVILEDQAWPKQCGHMDDKGIVDTEEHVRRIRAAADVRAEREYEFVIVGRTDAREAHGIEAAIERGHAYADAGADVVFVEAPQSREELERVADAFAVPTFANMVEGGKTPFCSADELEAMGFDIVVYPLSALFAATRAIQETYERLATEGTTAGIDGVSFAEFERVIGAPALREQEARDTEKDE